MTYAAIAIAAVGAIVSATAAVKQGQAAQASANFQAEQAQANAVQSRAAASTQEDEQRAKARAMVGTQLAAQGQAGTQLNGSASDILRESLFNAEADAQNIRYQGENAARGYSNAAAGSLLEGKWAKTNSYLSAAGSLIGGAGSAYGAYKKGT